MKKVRTILHYLLKVLPHINIVLAVTLLTLFITDRYNRAMAFINNDITKWMLCVFCITVVIEAIALTYVRRCEARERNAAIDAEEREGKKR